MRENDKDKRPPIVTLDELLQRKLADSEIRRSFLEHRQALAIGIEIARLRKEEGLSQSQLAKKAGMNKQNVSRLEQPGYQKYSLFTLQRIAAALDRELVVKFVKRSRQGTPIPDADKSSNKLQ